MTELVGDDRGAQLAPGTPHVLGLTPAAIGAFHELYVRDFATLTRYASRLVDDHDLARELTQDAYTRLFARWRKVDDPGAYVFLILTNLVRDHWQRRDRERRAMRWLRHAPPAQESPRAESLREGIETLPPRLRDLVLLHYFADQPMDVVAATLGRPLGTVKRQLHEARQLLQAFLDDHEDGAHG